MLFFPLNNIYLYIFFFLILVIFISILLFTLSYFFNSEEPYFEKTSAYECGFEPFVDTRVRFDVRFYLVGLLFLVFDIEIMFLYPWVLCFNNLTLFNILVMLCFLVILLLGFVYEWQKGALNWS